MKKILLFSLLYLTFNVSADKSQTFNENANWAKQTSKNMLAPSNLPLNINDYCKDATCRSQVNNPTQTSLNDSNMSDKAAQALATNDLAKGIRENTNKPRPDFKSDQKMRYALLGQSNAYEISHGQSNKYVNCDTGKQCVFEDSSKVCHSPTLNPVPCEKVPILTEETTGLIDKTQCLFNDTHVWAQFSPSFSVPIWGGKNAISRPPAVAYTRGIYKGIGTGTMAGVKVYEICQTVKVCPAGYILRGSDCARNKVSWSAKCTLLKECKPISERCIEPGGTRTVRGIPTTLICWKYEILHTCELPDSCGKYPDCKEKKRECNLKLNGVCVEEKVTKTCSTENCRTVTLTCGEKSFCRDGSCYVPNPTLNTEFDKSAAALAALGEAAKGLGNPPQIFTGKPMHCSEAALGFANCCKDSGWGTDIGIASCNENEKALGKAKEKGLTIYVGRYCAEKVLGACIRKKRAYCVYGSKLSKIIQEQGAIGQLGKTLGSAKSPTCAALTPEELSQINFDHVDFKEFYPDLHKNIKMPDPNVIKKRIQNSVGG